MTEIQKSFRAFLGSEIPFKELAAMIEKYGLDLEPGATFLDALAVRAAQLAESSPQWAELFRDFEQMGNSDDE